jgi:hypothetical protein
VTTKTDEELLAALDAVELPEKHRYRERSYPERRMIAVLADVPGATEWSAKRMAGYLGVGDGAVARYAKRLGHVWPARRNPAAPRQRGVRLPGAQDRLRALFAEQPAARDWTAVQLARELGVTIATAQETARLLGHQIPFDPESRTHKMTEDQVRAAYARVRDGETLSAVARDLGVTMTNISAIVRRQTWRHLDLGPPLTGLYERQATQRKKPR